MNVHRTTARALRGISLSAALMTGALLVPAAAIAQDAITHLNVVPGRIVQLASRFSESGVCEQQQRSGFDLVKVKPNGDLANARYIVPRDKVFIVTDVIWSAFPRVTDTFIAGHSLEARVLTYPGSGPDQQQLVQRLSPLLIPEGAQNSILGGTTNLTAGFVVPGGNGLCMAVRRIVPAGFSREWIQDVRIIGYIGKLP